MKVALVNQPWNDAAPPVQSGSIAIWIYQVSQHLSQSCDVIVYGKRDRLRKKEESKNGIHYRYVSIYVDSWIIRILKILKKRFFKYLSIPFNSKRPGFSKWWYYFVYIFQVALDVRKMNCDIVHIQNLSQFVPIIRAFNPGIKIVLHMHCEWLTQFEHKMITRRLNETDLVLACSAYITEKISHHFPQFANRCQTLYNGVDVDHFVSSNNPNTTKKNKTKRLLFVGRISPEKGLHILLDAFQDVVKLYPLVELNVVGPEVALPKDFIYKLFDDPKISNLSSFREGSYLSYLQTQLSSKLGSQIVFSGTLPHSDLVPHYCNATVYVQPSFIEAFPLPIPEAMAIGIPVVATRVGGIPEAVEEGKTGILVESGDTAALAEALVRLLSDEALRESMGRAARKRAVALFSWEHIAKNLLCSYHDIMERDD